MMSGHLPPIHPPSTSLPYPPLPPYEFSPAPGGAGAGAASISPQSPVSAGQHGHLGGPRPADLRSYATHGPVPPMTDGSHRYGSEYELGSPGLAGHRMDHMIPGGLPHPGHLSAHKRAYRQRRKDPSCDACRERKVKCDATDASSCSECSSRNVKCQFTKETNRRMSSLKQVQDLEKQLMAARQQVSRYRSMVKGDTTAIEDEDSQLDAVSPSKRRKLDHHNSASIRWNMEQCGRGLFSAPFSEENNLLPPVAAANLPSLPPRDVADRLLQTYESTVQSVLPFLHWPSILQLANRLYEEDAILETPADSIALFFACLTRGALVDSVSSAQQYFECVQQVLNFWSEAPSLNLVRATLLCCIYLIEAGQTRHAFTTIGYTVRVAQDIGLHRRLGIHSLLEEELRQKLWSAVVWAERALSLQIGRPTMLSDDEVLGSGLYLVGSPSTCQLPDPFEALLQVAGVVPQIQKLFRSAEAPTILLATIDEQLLRMLSPYVREAEANPQESPDPAALWMSIHIYSTQLILHRHNLSPASSYEVKRSALTYCRNVASDTARLLLRVDDSGFHTPTAATDLPSKFDEAVRTGPAALLIMHLWRCVMHLVYAFDFEGAQICTRLLARMGSLRPINRACGAYLDFFLEALAPKIRRSQSDLLGDDELLAYLSADLQNNLDQAWIWTSGGKDSPIGGHKWAERNGIRTGKALPHEKHWDNWPRILTALRQLSEDYRSGSRVTEPPSSAPGHATPLAQQPPPSSKTSSRPTTAATSATTTSPNSANNRVSIADLMG